MPQVWKCANAIVVTGTTDIIEATIRARRMWNASHPGERMPEGFVNHDHDYVWFSRPRDRMFEGAKVSLTLFDEVSSSTIPEGWITTFTDKMSNG